jgi:hypothetical protein
MRWSASIRTVDKLRMYHNPNDNIRKRLFVRIVQRPYDDSLTNHGSVFLWLQNLIIKRFTVLFAVQIWEWVSF